MQVAGTGLTLHSTHGTCIEDGADGSLGVSQRRHIRRRSSGVDMQVAGTGPILHSTHGA